LFPLKTQDMILPGRTHSILMSCEGNLTNWMEIFLSRLSVILAVYALANHALFKKNIGSYFVFVQHWSVYSVFFQGYVNCSFSRHCLGSIVLTNIGEFFSWHVLCNSNEMYTLCLTKRVFLTQWPMYERHDKHEIQFQFVACLKSCNIQAGRLALPYSFFYFCSGRWLNVHSV
jgi:hypothetical protein